MSKEIKRIKSLFEKLYGGKPWLDVNIIDNIKVLNAQQASIKLNQKTNSIWEITNHMINWRLNVIERIHDKMMPAPDHNYFQPVDDQSESEWQATIKKLESTQVAWLNLLENFDEENFEKIYPGNAMNYYEHIQGIIQHDAYHLGQITLLSRLIK